MFKKVELNAFSFPIFDKMSSPGAILCAGNLENHNAMAIGWATLGVLWGKKVATVYVRPTRFTFSLIETGDYFTICFFDDSQIVQLLGSVSGKTVNKEKAAKITPLSLDEAVAYQEAYLVIVCRKIYSDVLKPGLIPFDVNEKYYGSGDYHHFYVGEIINIYRKEC